MPIPDATSPQALGKYLGSKCIAAGRGEAWRDLQVSLYVAPKSGVAHIPAVNEPLLLWTAAGEVAVEERDGERGPWVKGMIRPGTFYLTTSSGPYYCRWRTLSTEPFEHMMVLVSLPLMQRALAEVFGADAAHARLRDVSAFSDEPLHALMRQLHRELIARDASALVVQGLAQVIAVHLARNYSEFVTTPTSGSPALPGFKLRQITGWMADHLDDHSNLDQLAAQAGLSKFHFQRLFKNAVGLSPSSYHTHLRVEAAGRLLRETKRSVTDIAFALGYANSSYFAQVFRRETGLSPGAYRRQR